jgi:phosphatidylglycerol---prolipoprotein diacylglyceryl transferase
VIPYFEQPSLDLGPVTIYGFGVLVAVAVIVGTQAALRRFRTVGIDPDVGMNLVFYVLVFGFLAAHLFAVLTYFPDRLAEDPLLLLKVWENISSFGGLGGGLLGFWIFFRYRERGLPADAKWAYLDAVAFVFPFAWAIGRLGCTIAHDHPGTVTTFPLGISLASPEAREYVREVYFAAGRLGALPPSGQLAGMAFHDLGWYEFLYTLLVIVPAFLLLDRRPRPRGFFPLVFVLLYAPPRFALDFLRLSDSRYLGLTPGQYMALAVFAVALVLYLYRGSGRSGSGSGGSGPAKIGREKAQWAGR